MVFEYGFEPVEGPAPGDAYDNAVGELMQDRRDDLFDQVRFDGEDDDIAAATSVALRMGRTPSGAAVSTSLS